MTNWTEFYFFDMLDALTEFQHDTNHNFWLIWYQMGPKNHNLKAEFNSMWNCCNYQQRGRKTFFYILSSLSLSHPLPLPVFSLHCQLFTCQWKLLLIKVKKQTTKRRWAGVEGGTFFAAWEEFHQSKREFQGLGWKWGGRGGGERGAECHPHHPRTWKKCFVSSGFQRHCNYRGTRGDRTSLHWSSRAKNKPESKEPRLRELNRGIPSSPLFPHQPCLTWL